MSDQTPPLEFGAVEPIEIQEEMERSFLEYSMSVIVSRALPDARDGLKPVHRKILYAMHDMGARSDRPRLKCARVSGDVMGKYHPHGEGAIYDALVRMAQDFSLRHPLVKGPDFPTGALILGRAGILDAYRTGRGSIRVRARAEIDERKNGTYITVTELPWQASPAAILKRIVELVE